MALEIESRAMSEDERRVLQMLRDSMSAVRKCHSRFVDVFMGAFAGLGFAILIVGGLAWWLMKWLAPGLRAWLSSNSLALAAGVFVLLVVVSAATSFKWMRGWRAGVRDSLDDLDTDLAGGHVREERYVFSAIKSVREPEHGGLIYLLKIDDRQALVVFDSESQDIALQEGDPLTSSMKPADTAILVRAPASSRVLSLEFSGTAFDKTPEAEIGVPVDQWPDDEQVWQVAWTDVDRKLGLA